MEIQVFRELVAKMIVEQRKYFKLKKAANQVKAINQLKYCKHLESLVEKELAPEITKQLNLFQ